MSCALNQRAKQSLLLQEMKLEIKTKTVYAKRGSLIAMNQATSGPLRKKFPCYH